MNENKVLIIVFLALIGMFAFYAINSDKESSENLKSNKSVSVNANKPNSGEKQNYTPETSYSKNEINNDADNNAENEQNYPERTKYQNEQSKDFRENTKPAREQNEIVLSGSTRSVRIYDISEYDFKTKKEIYDTRKYVVSKTMGDLVQDYKINERVFGAIEDNRPWWGMEGIMCKSTGQNSIDGPSEESRFMNNPLILVGLDLNFAMKIPNWNCSGVYPKPREILLKPSLNKIAVTYNMTDYNRKVANTAWANRPDAYLFAARNARDFGYEYGYVSSYSGLKFNNEPNISTQVHKFLDYIHRGGSCGYEGGCNNGSPSQPGLEFGITSLPAKAEFKLFRHAPQSKDDTPDLVFQLFFE